MLELVLDVFLISLDLLRPRYALPPQHKRVLSAIVNDPDDGAVVKEKKEKALAEHLARHPEDVGRTVEDFKWILAEIVRSWPMPETQEWRDAWEAGRHPLQLREAGATKVAKP